MNTIARFVLDAIFWYATGYGVMTVILLPKHRWRILIAASTALTAFAIRGSLT